MTLLLRSKIHGHRIALVFVFLGTLIYGQAACSKTNPSPEPSPESTTPDPNKVVDDILAKYAAAVGGQSAIEQVKSYAGKGTFSMSIFKQTGTYAVWGKHPNKTLSVIRFPGGIVVKKGFDGETRWVQTPKGISTEEGPAEMAEIERDADIYGAGRIKDLYASMHLEGKARLKGRDVVIVEGKPEKGPTEKLLFDAENGLLMRWDMIRRHAKKGNVFVKVHLDNYTDVEGIKIPFNVRFAFESFDLTIKISELTHNVPLEDALFQKPKT